MRDEARRASYYANQTVSMVWGIGGKTVERLNRLGVVSIADFMRMTHEKVRELLTVTGARVQAELHGQSCLPLNLMPPPRQGIAVARTFGQMASTWTALREAVAAFATRAAEKLRAEGLEAGHSYFKAGVMLANLTPARQQGQMFTARDTVKSARAMAAIDAVNARFGRGMLRPAATGTTMTWASRQARHSPRYTTRAEEMLVAKAF
ncbi:DUF4113 domain-containing protein [Acidocella sp. MX-AZ02]|uniref:DUF4113 domain-containing protein n=1 Tax=Acidocella sp. MX-AZ02 TaxID=1214225 RepID=UPI00028CB92E|nr:DUF4113 domain-containing protein [Acidocella sp. MX-AZ02]EKM99086.1 UmuC protein [Acidocella sp. MX-AZ02]